MGASAQPGPQPQPPSPFGRVRRGIRLLPVAVLWGWVVLAGSLTEAQTPVAPSDEEQVIAIDYPEQLPLEALVDFVSRTLDLRILYVDELRGQTVQLKPGHIELPRARLFDFLVSVLSMRGLAMMEGDLPGFYRIAAIKEAQRLTREVRSTESAETPVTGRIVTQAIGVRSKDLRSVAKYLEPFASMGKSGILEVPERNMLLVTDYEAQLDRIGAIVRLLDGQGALEATEVVPVKHEEPDRLIELIERLLADSVDHGKHDSDSLVMIPGLDRRSIVLRGLASEIERATALIHQFDTRTGQVHRLEVYTLEFSSSERLGELIRRVACPSSAACPDLSNLHVDTDVNRLYITGSDRMHKLVSDLLDREDVPSPGSTRPTRIYRPKNRTATEILGTLAQLLEESEAAEMEPAALEEAAPGDPLTAQQVNPPAQTSPREETRQPQGDPALPRRVSGPDYVLTEDEATNAIIATGSPEFHAQLADLIEDLDRRPAQVLVEVKLCAVTLSNSLDLGVELEALDLGNPWDYIFFTSFGLSAIDPVTGQRTLTPGVGINGAVIAPDEIPFIFRALATHGDTRIISTPRLLVSDNRSATLRNVDEAPFTSVNASDTVATTSFAGFASAGTTLNVTPHIAEGDHLTLEYDLSFSSFSGPSSQATVPPPRTTNSFVGEVQVPDGHTIILGGLEVRNESDTQSEVPFLGEIPVLEWIFGSRAKGNTQTRIYAFIRPVILREETFGDLNNLSREALEDADLENIEFTKEGYMWMR